MTKNAVTAKTLTALYPTLAALIHPRTWESLVRARCNGRDLGDLVNAGLPKLEELARAGAKLQLDGKDADYPTVVRYLCGRGEAEHATGIAEQVKATGLTRREVTPACKAMTRKQAEEALKDIMHAWRGHRTRSGIRRKKAA